MTRHSVMVIRLPPSVPVPEPEIEEEEELTAFAEDDDEGGGILNAEEIEAAKTVNRELAQAWLDCVSDCEEQASGAFEGVHFHWLMSDVDQGEITNIASSGGVEAALRTVEIQQSRIPTQHMKNQAAIRTCKKHMRSLYP